jgi:putative transcriptional regulator
MTAKKIEPGRLARALLDTAADMRRAGILDQPAHDKITMRHLGGGAFNAAPLEPLQIRTLRQDARMSQAVFARHLNVTAGYVSQLERGTKKPTGAALALLNVIWKKGIDVVL